MGIFSFLSKDNDWVLIGTTVAEPQEISSVHSDKLPPSTLEKALFGYTTYVYQNSQGQIKKEEYLGVDETPLQKLINRADKSEKVEIHIGDNRYVLVKLQEPTPATQPLLPSNIDISRLPVR